jgi:hypothetical protein
VAKTAETTANTTRLAAAAVQSSPWVPKLVKLWPSSLVLLGHDVGLSQIVHGQRLLRFFFRLPVQDRLGNPK